MDEPSDEEEHERVEPCCSLLVLHVGNGIEQHGGADAGSHEGEQEGQTIDMIGELDGTIPMPERGIEYLP